MIINVTYDDIDKGNAAIDACPVTVALQRRFGKKISVSRNYIRVPKKRTRNKWNFIPLPVVARNFILNFYKYHTPQPFSFELTAKNIKVLKG